jgi:hypothetical protein
MAGGGVFGLHTAILAGLGGVECCSAVGAVLRLCMGGIAAEVVALGPTLLLFHWTGAVTVYPNRWAAAWC